MRIVGGLAKGRRLKSPVGDVRPTASRVRESIFNILQGRVEGATFLDLFAGSGAVGLEALSRGAEHVVFVEENRARAEAVERFARELGWSGRASVMKMSASKYLARPDARGFDIVFVDPPYRTSDMPEVLPVILACDTVAPGGILVLEHLSNAVPAETLDGFNAGRRYRYGDTMLSVFFRPEAGAYNMEDGGEP
ncbi:MAG: 16S rRNA (guanine(966)-N(2))-methyltransferase RsmD [Nitrospirae bacterium]|nr:16S rRNA (guanine(966)-N(2))-methyltransferase RsmD [Nitrospirota bacterium]